MLLGYQTFYMHFEIDFRHFRYLSGPVPNIEPNRSIQMIEDDKV